MFLVLQRLKYNLQVRMDLQKLLIRNWNVNIFERDFENIGVDDGFVGESIDDTSLEYSHLYALDLSDLPHM